MRFQVPDPRLPFLGVHFTPRMNGGLFNLLSCFAVLASFLPRFLYIKVDLSISSGLPLREALEMIVGNATRDIHLKSSDISEI